MMMMMMGRIQAGLPRGVSFKVTVPLQGRPRLYYFTVLFSDILFVVDDNNNNKDQGVVLGNVQILLLEQVV